MTELPDGRARAAKIAFALAVGVLVLVVGTVFVLSQRRDAPPVDRQVTIDPAEETSTETTMPPSVEPTTPAETPTETPGSTSTASARAPKIAYRVGGTIYVAGEDGGSPAPVVKAAEGPYALSPDGRNLAVVTGGRLLVVPVGGGKQVSLAGAEAARPVWTPDSRSVLWVRSKPGSHGVLLVMRVNADGKGATELRQGASVRVSPDGSVMVVQPLPGAMMGETTKVYASVRGGAFKGLTVKGFSTAVAATADRVIVAIARPEGGPALISMNLSGRDSRQLFGAPADGAMATWTDLSVSPDGRLLAAAATGDDGYSRVSVIPVGGGSARPLLPRKDAYIRDWSADGARIFLIEGNQFQGQSTSLVSVAPDGTGRRVVITGVEP